MAQQYADNKEQVAERLIRLLSQGWGADDNYLEYAKQFYLKTAEAYKQWKTACRTLNDAVAEELHST